MDRLTIPRISGLKARLFPTPVGWYGLAYTDDALVLLRGPQDSEAETFSAMCEELGHAPDLDGDAGDLGHRATEQLMAYHAGERVEFDAPLELSYIPPFTRAALLATASIPYGEVRPYGWVAAQAGNPRAARAAGQAVHVNPLAPIIPCHRVVAAGGLGGFGKRMDLKEWYLRLEGYLK